MHARFSNLPLQLIGVLHRNLLEDLGWSQRQRESEGVSINSDSFNFASVQHILLLARVSKPDDMSRCTRDVTGSSSLLFDLFEDEVYFQASIAAVIMPSRVNPEFAIVAAILPVNVLERCVKQIREIVPTE